jgi:hypothetical protein
VDGFWQGFIFMAIFMFAIACKYNTLANGEHVVPFLILYSFTFFFANFGPNTMTFIIPAELFPARFRATCHGISAASGKLGAIVGAFGFLYASQDRHPRENPRDNNYPPGIGPKITFFLMAGVCVLGAAFTLLIPETKGRSLEEITGENDFDFTPHDIAVHGMRGVHIGSPLSVASQDSSFQSSRRSPSQLSIDTPDLQPSRLSSARTNTTESKVFSGILNSPDDFYRK